jgi:hypothetical protein
MFGLTLLAFALVAWLFGWRPLTGAAALSSTPVTTSESERSTR